MSPKIPADRRWRPSPKRSKVAVRGFLDVARGRRQCALWLLKPLHCSVQSPRPFREPLSRSRIKGIPMLKGLSIRLRIRRERFSTRSCPASAFDFSAASAAVMYFRKSTPHFSQVPPRNCSCLHAGHWKRSVAWQRGQKRAASLACVSHFGHFMMELYASEACVQSSASAACLRSDTDRGDRASPGSLFEAGRPRSMSIYFLRNRKRRFWFGAEACIGLVQPR